MFGSLARRLTGWYVVVAVALVVSLAGAIIFTGLFVYAKDANEQIQAFAHQVPDVESRALSEHDDWDAARALLLRRLARPGLVVKTHAPPPPPRSPHEAGYFRYSDVPPLKGVAARRLRPIPDEPLFSNRFGYIAASSLGIRSVRQAFMGGTAIVFVDVDRTQAIVEVSLAVLLVTGCLAAIVAWTIGRYITLQAMRPLYDVTSALIRFAGRDFSAQPIDVAGRSEFDELVQAYNAAADQVAIAFAERAVAENQMRQFVADAGHELRTPLTILLGYIDIIKRGAPADERSRRIFDTIAIEGTRMRTLIDNLVLLARLEGDDIRPVEPFELTPLIEKDIVTTRLAISPGVRIELDIGCDATVIADRGEIYEAFANILDNAIKYAPGSPILIRVQKYRDGAVSVDIIDRGPGIAISDQVSIFDRFFRGTLRGDVEGSGLGLPIAKRAVLRAGGSLTLAHSGSTGTTFTIVLRADRITECSPRPRPLGRPTI